MNAHAQARAFIHLAHRIRMGLAQAFVVKPAGYAQAQAQIKHTYMSSGQSQGTIKKVVYGFAQAQAYINARFTYGQANATIKKTSRVFAQAGAYILRQYGVGQAQSNIKTTSRLFSQAQANIRLTESTLDTNVVLRTVNNGGYTPTIIYITGTHVTVSGYTDNGEFTGFLSISGYVENLIVDTENSSVIMDNEVRNDLINNLDYGVYVAPGRTYFEVTGATEITITYVDRWYL